MPNLAKYPNHKHLTPKSQTAAKCYQLLSNICKTTIKVNMKMINVKL